jgi:hypothetical protein
MLQGDSPQSEFSVLLFEVSWIMLNPVMVCSSDWLFITWSRWLECPLDEVSRAAYKSKLALHYGIFLFLVSCLSSTVSVCSVKSGEALVEVRLVNGLCVVSCYTSVDMSRGAKSILELSTLCPRGIYDLGSKLTLSELIIRRSCTRSFHQYENLTLLF